MRTGIGYDVHKLVEGRKLVLGGVEIPHEKGLLGHSDADALLHAITDAILGAAGLGDIGQHFPDSDPQFKGMDSLKFLEITFQKIKAKGLKVNNIDSVIIAESPKLSPHKEKMKANIAKVLQMNPEDVNVKATTEEGLGFTGKKEGMAAWAVVTLG
ncbi:MAG: 2-C-methyl-D-erythritol 2,4-cyclodiphosphate synthase [Deltaproteobacteria bacterium GWA2_45_12]|nr:MAG: 2-C-methyl-D-erythritol 2,4-cyclodiphosphate synthase [Deltaproteobacteria bacterium GWA2_45_12]